jgi:hypothetical protein
MPIATAMLAHPRRTRRSQRRLQLLLYDGLDRRPNAIADHTLDRVRAERLLFSPSRLPAIAPHGVILRHPPSRGHSCGQLRRMMTPFLAFPPDARHYHGGWVESVPNIFGGRDYRYPDGRTVTCQPNIFGDEDCR